MKLSQLFDVGGRLPRRQFWLQALALWVLLYLLSAGLGALATGVVVWVLNGAVLLLLALLCIRRLHDRDYTGWWLLTVLIPVAGALWLVWQLALRRGVAQENRWGQDPLQSHGDYLVVG